MPEVLLVDCSGSMASGAFTTAIDTVRGMESETLWMIPFTLGTEGTITSGFAAALEARGPGGGTNIQGALMSAFSSMGALVKQHIRFKIITDAEDSIRDFPSLEAAWKDIQKKFSAAGGSLAGYNCTIGSGPASADISKLMQTVVVTLSGFAAEMEKMAKLSKSVGATERKITDTHQRLDQLVIGSNRTIKEIQAAGQEAKQLLTEVSGTKKSIEDLVIGADEIGKRLASMKKDMSAADFKEGTERAKEVRVKIVKMRCARRAVCLSCKESIAKANKVAQDLMQQEKAADLQRRKVEANKEKIAKNQEKGDGLKEELARVDAQLTKLLSTVDFDKKDDMKTVDRLIGEADKISMMFEKLIDTNSAAYDEMDALNKKFNEIDDAVLEGKISNNQLFDKVTGYLKSAQTFSLAQSSAAS